MLYTLTTLSAPNCPSSIPNIVPNIVPTCPVGSERHVIIRSSKLIGYHLQLEALFIVPPASCW